MSSVVAAANSTSGIMLNPPLDCDPNDPHRLLQHHHHHNEQQQQSPRSSSSSPAGMTPLSPASASASTSISPAPPLHLPKQRYGSATEAANAAAAQDAAEVRTCAAVNATAVSSGCSVGLGTSGSPESPHDEVSLAVFDTHFDEQAFVSALLENNGESAPMLPILQ